MALLIYLLLLAIGMISLWYSGERSITYIEKLAKIYGLNTFFLGFFLLAFSTGLPELSIAIQSVIMNVATLALGDIVGSNFIDVAFVLGLPTIMFGTVNIINRKRTMLMLLIDLMVMSLIFFSRTITKMTGALFITIYFLVTWFLWKIDSSNTKQNVASNKINGTGQESKALVFIQLFISLFFVLLASKLCVSSAIQIFKYTSVPLEVLGATIIAFGTSLPEVTLNIIAVKRGDHDLAIGNSLGSVFMQGSFVLGLLPFLSDSHVDTASIQWIAPFFYLAFLIVGLGIFFRKKLCLLEGILLLILSIIFFVYSYSAQLFM